MDSERSNSTRKPIKRRSHTRRGTKNCFINMAEARREVAKALQLHRSSTSASSSSSSSSDQKWVPTIIGDGCNHGISYSCSSLLDTLPLPEPTYVWSTTAPSVLATPSPPMEALEFEWAPENLASSYTWWLGFLNGLDDGKHTEVVPKYPFEENNIVWASTSRLFRPCPDGSVSELGDPRSLDEITDQSSYLDEWLTVPTIEDEGEMMM